MRIIVVNEKNNKKLKRYTSSFALVAKLPHDQSSSFVIC